MFMWTDDNPAVLAHSVQSLVKDSSDVQSSTSPQTTYKKIVNDYHDNNRTAEPFQLVGWQKFALRKYRDKLELFVTDELKAEIRRLNTRNTLSAPAGCKPTLLKVSGNRSMLVERLMGEALLSLVALENSKSSRECHSQLQPLLDPSLSHQHERTRNIPKFDDGITSAMKRNTDTSMSLTVDEDEEDYISLSDDDDDDDDDGNGVEDMKATMTVEL